MNIHCSLSQRLLLITGRYFIQMLMVWLKLKTDLPNSARHGNDVGHSKELVLGLKPGDVREPSTWKPAKTSHVSKQPWLLLQVRGWETDKRACRNQISRCHTHWLRQLSKLHLPLSDKINLALTSVLPKWGYSCESQILDWKELHNLQRNIVDSVWKLPSIGSPTVFFAWPNRCVTLYCGPFANLTVLKRNVLFSLHIPWRSYFSLEPLGRKEISTR